MRVQLTIDGGLWLVNQVHVLAAKKLNLDVFSDASASGPYDLSTGAEGIEIALEVAVLPNPEDVVFEHAAGHRIALE